MHLCKMFVDRVYIARLAGKSMDNIEKRASQESREKNTKSDKNFKKSFSANVKHMISLITLRHTVHL